MSQARRLWMLVSALLAGHALPAAADGYCVACFEPDAVYRCLVEGVPAGAPPDPRHQIQCIKHLAKQGGHARCSVERFSTAGCNGPIAMIDPANDAIPLGPAPQPAASAETPLPEKSETGPVAPAAAPSQPEITPDAPASDALEQPGTSAPPRTVEELAKNAAESTKRSLDTVTGTVKETTRKAGEQIEGAGSAVGTAAAKTWNCLSSFFTDCGSDEDSGN